MAPARRTFRETIATGILVGLVAVVAAHLYRSLYLLAGGTSFAEINVVTTTLAAFVPTFLAALVYAPLVGRVRWARAAFTAGVLAFTALSLVPLFVAPLHPGFAAMSAPLHAIVGVLVAFGIPWHHARGPPSLARAAELAA